MNKEEKKLISSSYLETSVRVYTKEIIRRSRLLFDLVCLTNYQGQLKKKENLRSTETYLYDYVSLSLNIFLFSFDVLANIKNNS